MPAFLAYMHQLETLAFHSASLNSLIRFRLSHPRGIHCDGLSQWAPYASEIISILINYGLAGNTIGFHAGGLDLEKDMRTRAEWDLTGVSEQLKTFEWS